MSFKDSGAKGAQPLRHRGRLQILSRIFVSEVQLNFGYTTHPDTANADKVDALYFGKHLEKNIELQIQYRDVREFQLLDSSQICSHLSYIFGCVRMG